MGRKGKGSKWRLSHKHGFRLTRKRAGPQFIKKFTRRVVNEVNDLIAEDPDCLDRATLGTDGTFKPWRMKQSKNSRRDLRILKMLKKAHGLNERDRARARNKAHQSRIKYEQTQRSKGGSTTSNNNAPFGIVNLSAVNLGSTASLPSAMGSQSGAAPTPSIGGNTGSIQGGPAMSVTSDAISLVSVKNTSDRVGFNPYLTLPATFNPVNPSSAVEADGTTTGITERIGSGSTVVVDNRPRDKEWWEKSDTIRIHPIPRSIREPQILEFINPLIACLPKYMHISVGFHVNRALVVLHSKEDAIKIAEQLHHQCIGDFEVSIDIVKPIDTTYLKHRGSNWVTFTNLDHSVTEQDLMTSIQTKGEIDHKPNNIYLHHHPERVDVPGFAFVECATPLCAQTLKVELRTFSVNGCTAYCTLRSGKDIGMEDMETNRRKQDHKKTNWIRIGHLHYSMTERDVYDLCGRYGPVMEVYCGYYRSGHPMGSAVVLMKNKAMAARIFKELHGKIVNNLKLTTSYIINVNEYIPARRRYNVADASNRSATMVAISPIPRHLKHPDLFEFVSQVAVPLNIRMFTNLKEHNPNFNHSMIEFQKPTEAIKVAAYLKTQRLCKMWPLSMDVVSDAVPPPPVPNHWVKITNLHSSTKEVDFLEMIERVGCQQKLSRYVWCQHPLKKEYPGFVHIEFESVSDAVLVVDKLNMSTLKGKTLWCAAMRPKEEWTERNELFRGQSRWIRIWYFNGVIDAEELNKICSRSGSVESVRLEYNAVGYPRGSAIVRMESADDAITVFDAVNGMLNERGVTLQTAFWSPLASPERFAEEKMETVNQTVSAALKKEPRKRKKSEKLERKRFERKQVKKAKAHMKRRRTGRISLYNFKQQVKSVERVTQQKINKIRGKPQLSKLKRKNRKIELQRRQIGHGGIKYAKDAKGAKLGNEKHLNAFNK